MRRAKDSADASATSSSTGGAGGRHRRKARAPAGHPKPPASLRKERARGSRNEGARPPVVPERQVPEHMLERAMHSTTPRSRAVWARRGLALRSPIDRTTQSLLLRQLYLAHYEGRQFDKAVEVAEQNIALGGLFPDVAHQDAARALQALGDLDGAAGHLRLAARVSPPKRKAFHWWTLGSLYFLAGRYEEAASAITRAARWGTTDKPLYQGHLAVAQCANGKKVRGLASLIDRLAEAPAGQGYGRFVLGQLAFYDGRRSEARRYLESFVKRSESGRRAMAIALEGEVKAARTLLATLAG